MIALTLARLVFRSPVSTTDTERALARDQPKPSTPLLNALISEHAQLVHRLAGIETRMRKQFAQHAPPHDLHGRTALTRISELAVQLQEIGHRLDTDDAARHIESNQANRWDSITKELTALSHTMDRIDAGIERRQHRRGPPPGTAL